MNLHIRTAISISISNSLAQRESLQENTGKTPGFTFKSPASLRIDVSQSELEVGHFPYMEFLNNF